MEHDDLNHDESISNESILTDETILTDVNYYIGMVDYFEEYKRKRSAKYRRLSRRVKTNTRNNRPTFFKERNVDFLMNYNIMMALKGQAMAKIKEILNVY